MYSHGPHIDVTDLELSPIVGMWSDIWNGTDGRRNWAQPYVDFVCFLSIVCTVSIEL
jgi:hypothetical protein